MAIKQGREYRALQDFSLVPREENSPEYRVRGTAIVFNTPTVLWECDGVEYGAMGEEMLAEVDSGLAAVNDKLKSSIGEIETGFSAKATVEAVSASVPADLTGRGGGATTSGGGDTNVVNHFHIAELVVREEADVKKISRELYNMQKSKSRSKGVSMA